MQTTTIKASELRIGNLRQVNGKYVNAINGATIGHIEMGIIDFIPIPLTDEWLMEFGFDKSDEYNTYEKIIGGFTLTFRHNVKWYSEIKHALYLADKYQYVHQLQNLYFALTGTELKRKVDSNG